MAQSNLSVNDAGSAETAFTATETFATAELSNQFGADEQTYFGQGKIWAHDESAHVEWLAKYGTSSGTNVALLARQKASPNTLKFMPNADHDSYIERDGDDFKVVSEGTAVCVFNNDGISTSSSDPSAASSLDGSNATKPWVVPNLTTAQRKLITSPVSGSII